MTLAVAVTGALVALAVSTNPAAQTTITVGQDVNDVKFGTLVNAPNGHISFRKESTTYRVWVSGRYYINRNDYLSGGFLFDKIDAQWDKFRKMPMTPVLAKSGDCNSSPDLPEAFDRNYAALNAVIPGNEPGKLLGFYDAEFHVKCPVGEPLLSTIGLATSIDGGQTWQDRQLVIQGQDAVQDKLGIGDVANKQETDPRDSGASGPSAVVRLGDDGDTYIYLYFADRRPFTNDGEEIYLSRARLSTDGLAGNWQNWSDGSWAAVGDQKSIIPIVTAALPGDIALQPHVSWNTALQRWVMVFKSTNDFEIAQSTDGVSWSPSVSLKTFDSQDVKTGFPTLVSFDDAPCPLPGCDRFPIPWGQLLPTMENTQQATGAVAWLYYSAQQSGNKFYTGHRVQIVFQP